MAKRKGAAKTSSELCAELGINDVELDYTSVDFKNLTSIGLFSRMVKPNLQSANPGASSWNLTTILEQKWKEFQAMNPYAGDVKSKEKTPSTTVESAANDDVSCVTADSSDDEGSSTKKQQPVKAKTVAPLKIKLFGGKPIEATTSQQPQIQQQKRVSFHAQLNISFYFWIIRIIGLKFKSLFSGMF